MKRSPEKNQLPMLLLAVFDVDVSVWGVAFCDAFGYQLCPWLPIVSTTDMSGLCIP